MVCSLFLSLLFLVAATRPAAAAASPTNRTVSYWFSVSSADAIPPFLALVSAHPAAISTVILDCGTAIAVNGSLPLPPLSAPCLAAVLGLNQLRIGVELAIGLANCSIAALRTFSTVAPAATGAALAAFARANNITGVSIDAEPQANNCAGSPTGSAADAIVFASGLAALRTPLNAAGVRLTICVADWSPVVGDYAVLAPAVDRLLDMETYTAPSWTTWLGYYHNIVRDDVPRAKVGIGMFPFATQNGTWPATSASVTQRLNQMVADQVEEAFIFRILPSETPPWPWSMWWQPLTDWLAGNLAAMEQ